MIVQTTQPLPEVSDDALRCFVVDALERGSNGSFKVAEIERRLYEYRSSFALEEVTAHLDDGTRLPLIFKNVGPENLLEDARLARVSFDYDPAREPTVYRDFLNGAELGTPACYAAAADDAKGRHWLLLEKASGESLAFTGEFSMWEAAARWLATAHVRLTSMLSEYAGAPSLLRYDANCFHGWIELAEQALERPQIAGGRTVAAWESRWLLERCRAAVEYVAALPVSFVHGEFYPSNVLVSARDGAIRICAVDWETAGVGPAALDLAALVTGSWQEQQKERLAAAYFDAVAGQRGGVREDDARMALACCRLLLAVQWVGRASRWRPPPERQFDWLAEALDVARMLNADLQQFAAMRNGS